MEDSSEKSFLIDNRKRFCKCKTYVIAFLIGACVVGACLALGFGFRSNKKHTGDLEGKQLGDVLPKSFSAEFSVQNPGTDEKNEMKIEWDVNARNLRYRETDSQQVETLRQVMAVNNVSHVSGNENLINITIVNDEAVLNVFDAKSDNWTWSCIPSLESILFHQIIQYALNATKTTNEKMIECSGNVWSYGNCNGCSPIYFCEKEASIISVQQHKMTAIVSGWTVPASHELQLPGDFNVSCKNISFSYQNTKSKSESKIGGTRNNRKYKNKVSSLYKDCLFVHGVGMDGPKTSYNVESSQKDYWGDVEYSVSRCSSTKFIRFDTITHGWDNHVLQESFCSFATSPNGNSTISNKRIYSHSMGNLIIAAALHRGVCKFDYTSEWFAVQAPWYGSHVADVLDEACRYQFNFVDGYITADILVNLLKFTQYCSWDGVAAPAFETLKTDYVSPDGTSFQDLVSVATAYVSGGLCGDSSWGMGKKWLYSSAFWALQAYANLPDPNDGVVNFPYSCELHMYTPDYESPFYLAQTNHFEGTCRFGDIDWIPWWWDDEKLYPCRWYENS